MIGQSRLGRLISRGLLISWYPSDSKENTPDQIDQWVKERSQHSKSKTVRWICFLLDKEKLHLQDTVSLNKANAILIYVWRSMSFGISDVQKQDRLGIHWSLAVDGCLLDCGHCCYFQNMGLSQNVWHPDVWLLIYGFHWSIEIV